MKTKTARAYAETISVVCPHCGEAIHDPKVGSLVWEAEHLQDAGMLTCQECGKPSWAPGRVLLRGES